jgi:hypothetical protein
MPGLRATLGFGQEWPKDPLHLDAMGSTGLGTTQARSSGRGEAALPTFDSGHSAACWQLPVTLTPTFQDQLLNGFDAARDAIAGIHDAFEHGPVSVSRGQYDFTIRITQSFVASSCAASSTLW